jgi:hypothetical protein
MIHPIVGAHFRPPAKAILQTLDGGAPLILRREPENPYDPNAIAVWVTSHTLSTFADLDALASNLPFFGHELEQVLNQEEWHLGYIPAKEAIHLAPLFPEEDVEGKLAFTATGAPAIAFEVGA